MSRALTPKHTRMSRDMCLSKQNSAPLSSGRIVPRVTILKGNSIVSHERDQLPLCVCARQYPANTRHWPNDCLMLGHRLRHRPNSKPSSGQRLVFARQYWCQGFHLGTGIRWTMIPHYYDPERAKGINISTANSQVCKFVYRANTHMYLSAALAECWLNDGRASQTLAHH